MIDDPMDENIDSYGARARYEESQRRAAEFNRERELETVVVERTRMATNRIATLEAELAKEKSRREELEAQSKPLRDQAVCLLYMLYRQFHEGGHFANEFSDAEVLEIVHDWLANNDWDPYTNGGPELIARLAAKQARDATGAYWQKMFALIASELPPASEAP